jgi:hypothetical protein
LGFELDGFLGRANALRRWKPSLPSARVCRLSGDLALLPVTGAVYGELRARVPEKERHRLDGGPTPRTFPAPSYREAVRRWGAEASEVEPVAFVSLGEFGNQSHEEVTVWSRGREVLARVPLRAALDYFRDRAALDPGDTPFDLERHRGEDAAEKWAAEGEE